MYNFDSWGEDSNGLSNQSPTIVIHDTPLPMHLEKVHGSPITENVSFERHSAVQEEDHPFSYNIEEIFGAFTFSLHRKEVSRKRVWKTKQNDGTLEEMQEDEVLFDKTNEDLVIVSIDSVSLTQGTTHNIAILNEKLLEVQ